MADGEKPVKPPVMREDRDLTTENRRTDNPANGTEPAEFRSPAAMMRQMGFEPNSGDLTPLQFLCAVMNDRADLIYRSEKKRKSAEVRGISIKHRVECAKTAVKYMHMQMPSVQYTKSEDDEFAKKLEKAVAGGQERVRTKRVILETVERISPDAPLADASYPTAFDPNDKPRNVSHHIVDDNEMVMDLDPEGDMEYNPDND